MSPEDLTTLVLCAGRGTRLAGHIPDGVNKCVADINGRPFLDLLLEKMESWGLTDFLISIGHASESIFKARTRALRFCGDDEDGRAEGTVKAVLNAIGDGCDISDPFFVVNGDTWIDFDQRRWEEIRELCLWFWRQNGGPVVMNDKDGTHTGLKLLGHSHFLDLARFAESGGTDLEAALRIACDPPATELRLSTDLFWIDIGTPEKLEAFRRMGQIGHV